MGKLFIDLDEFVITLQNIIDTEEGLRNEENMDAAYMLYLQGRIDGHKAIVASLNLSKETQHSKILITL
jgi:hypothetical protein